MQITKDMNIGQVVAANVELAPILEDACAGHGINVDALVEKLNEKLAEMESAAK